MSRQLVTWQQLTKLSLSFLQYLRGDVRSNP